MSSFYPGTLVCDETAKTSATNFSSDSAPPFGYTKIRDGQSVLLPDGWVAGSTFLGGPVQVFSPSASVGPVEITSVMSALAALIAANKVQDMTDEQKKAAAELLLSQQKQNASADSAKQALPFPSANPLFYPGYVPLANR